MALEGSLDDSALVRDTQCIILRQLNPVHAITVNFSKIRFEICTTNGFTTEVSQFRIGYIYTSAAS